MQPARGPIPAPHLALTPARATKVYDLEAEGGLRPTARAEQDEEPLDLMTAMRERSTARSRRKPGGRRGSPKAPDNVPGAGDQAPDQALPLADLAYDPETMPPPPGAHADPDPSGVDGRPEPGALPHYTDPGDVVAFEASSVHRTEKLDRVDRAVAAPGLQVKPEAPAAPATPATPAKASRKVRRPSVPAWDDIMFGSKPEVDRSSS